MPGPAVAVGLRLLVTSFPGATSGGASALSDNAQAVAFENPPPIAFTAGEFENGLRRRGHQRRNPDDCLGKRGGIAPDEDDLAVGVEKQYIQRNECVLHP